MEHNSDSTVTVAKTTRGDYTQEDRARAVALAQSERNMTRASEVLGIPLATISGWCRGLWGQIDPVQVAAAKQDQVAALESLTWKAIGYASDPCKMEAATLSQLAAIIGVTIDKAQLLRGAPTSIPGKPIDPDTLRARIRDILLDKAKQEAIDATPEPEQAGGGSTAETVPSAGDDREGTEPGYLEGTDGVTSLEMGSGYLTSDLVSVTSSGDEAGYLPPDSVDGTLGVTSGVLELE